jgi:hypothetical protein
MKVNWIGLPLESCPRGGKIGICRVWRIEFLLPLLLGERI